MVVRGVLDFEHIGTQAGTNADQNRREAMLGCAHAHDLFDSVEVKLKAPGAIPQDFGDYLVEVEFSEEKFPGVKLHRHVDPKR
jgi:CRISPR-associated protein Csd2